MLDFPSTSQVPTCVHPPKAKTTTSVNDGCSSDVEDSTKGKSLCYFSLQATPPTPPPSFIFLYSATCQMSEQDVLHFICWNRLLFPLTAHSWTEAQAHLLSSGLGAFSVPVVGLVLTTCCQINSHSIKPPHPHICRKKTKHTHTHSLVQTFCPFPPSAFCSVGIQALLHQVNMTNVEIQVQRINTQPASTSS